MCTTVWPLPHIGEEHVTIHNCLHDDETVGVSSSQSNVPQDLVLGALVVVSSDPSPFSWIEFHYQVDWYCNREKKTVEDTCGR